MVAALCAWGWCIAMSFGCERLRNIIILTVEFYFLRIIPLSLPFAGAYFILRHNWGILIPLTLPCVAKLWFPVEMEHEKSEKCPLEMSSQESSVIKQPDKLLFPNITSSLNVYLSFFACRVHGMSAKITTAGMMPRLTTEEFKRATMITVAW